MGLNFAPVSTKLPLQDTITGVARRLPQDDANDLWAHVCGIMRNTRLLNDKMKEYRVALKEVKKLKDEVILPVDKGNATVVINRSDYDGKMREVLSDSTTYKKLTQDPTPPQETKV